MVKLGSAVVTRSDGAGPALSRMANIVEQVSQLQAAGREMIIVSSGSVAAGRQILRTQSQLTQAGLYDCEHLPVPSRPMERLPPIKFPKSDSTAPVYSPAQCAAVGQSSLMSLYDAMFKVYGMGIGQVLVNAPVLERKVRSLTSPSTLAYYTPHPAHHTKHTCVVHTHPFQCTAQPSRMYQSCNLFAHQFHTAGRAAVSVRGSGRPDRHADGSCDQ